MVCASCLTLFNFDASRNTTIVTFLDLGVFAFFLTQKPVPCPEPKANTLGLRQGQEHMKLRRLPKNENTQAEGIGGSSVRWLLFSSHCGAGKSGQGLES